MYICICNDVPEDELINAIQHQEPLPTGNKCCIFDVISFLENLKHKYPVEHYIQDLNDSLKQLETSD